MIICPNCGAAVLDSEKFCGTCGTPMVPPSQASAMNEQTGTPQLTPVPPANEQSGPGQDSGSQYQQTNYQQANYQQANYQQANYQQPAYPQPYPQGPYSPIPQNSGQIITLGDWFVTILLTMIPVVNIILLFVWGFGSDTPESKSNWAKAQLIWMLISVVFSLLMVVLFGFSLAAMFQSLNY